MINIKRRFLFSLVTFLLVIALIELILIVASTISPEVKQLLSPNAVFNTVPDERLGHRPNPELTGHDIKGFRNRTVPNEARIVALGDSQTYGTGVKSHEAWPYILKQLSGDTVYSMAYGGYGPAHSLILWEEASSFNPDIYIVAFYSGNDLYDSFNLVYNRAQLPELKTSTKEDELNIRKKEKVGPIAKHVSRMFRMGRPKGQTSEQGTSFVKAFLSSHSKLYRLVRKAKHELFRLMQIESTESNWEYAKLFAEKNSSYLEIFEDKKFRTIFTPAYRHSAVNLDDIRIADGLRISLESIDRMNILAAEQKKRFMVVLIPTKELVFKELVQMPNNSYRILIENEERMWKVTKEFLASRSVHFIDVLPSLENQLSKGVQPYKVSHDGHPNRYGHEAIARLIYTEILKTHMTEKSAPANASTSRR